MHFDFRPLFRRTFAKLSRKYPNPQTQPSAGGASQEKQTPGALAFGSRKASLLEAWLLHLEIVSGDFRKQSSAVPAAGARRCFKTMVFGSPSEAWLLPMERCHSPAGPQAAGSGSP